ncbi:MULTISPECIES: LysR family transcriptional regulator [unclassified Sphingobium]|uniref:LysR family transcriptional regulator n=1 Tax=unclassified Sphingobium TaxID=2611147 RepID=UPI0007F3349B|nr:MULTISPECIES: LysR family transcriptional regulator [unclassified Sphingobium]OAN56634.1 LysR family transcriptional regulator [Sphingobium sp. TCM1]WIW90669.1 LysR family transcriptional regulator [Sphingobium sp. V4]
MIERYQLRYFLAVVDQGNFSRAAAHCNVAQPTLSVGIAKLERALGGPLFLRSGHRVELTQAGSRLLAHARRIEGEFNLAQQAMAGTAQGPLTRMGVLKSLPGATIGAIAREARRIDPSARLELVEGTERELLGHVARGRVDCALTLVERGSDRFLEEPLRQEGYALAVPLDHPAAAQASVAAETLNEDVMIVRRHCEALSETSRFFTERGVRPHFAYRSVNDERVMQMVAAGIGITLMPECYQAGDVARPRLAGFDLRRTIGLVYAATAEALAASPSAMVKASRALLGG